MIKPSLPSHCKPKKHWEHAEESHTSMVGSYSSTKWFWMSWMVSALLPTPPAPTTTSLYSVILAAAAHRTHTHTHAAAGEERGDRKRQVSILTDTHTHTQLDWKWCSPQVVIQTKHTDITITAQWWENVRGLCVRVCVVGAEVETLKGECEKCAEGTRCSNPLPLSVSSRECVWGGEWGRQWGRKRRVMTPADWPSSLRIHLPMSTFEPWATGAGAKKIR